MEWRHESWAFSVFFFLFFFFLSGAQGYINPGEKQEVDVFSPPPSQALTPCPHQLTYALLFIQAVRYHFGDGSTIDNRRTATTWTQSAIKRKIPKNWTERLEKRAFSFLLYITIFLYYLSSRKKKKMQTYEGKICETLITWSECSSRIPLKSVETDWPRSSYILPVTLEKRSQKQTFADMDFMRWIRDSKTEW